MCVGGAEVYLRCPPPLLSTLAFEITFLNLESVIKPAWKPQGFSRLSLPHRHWEVLPHSIFVYVSAGGKYLLPHTKYFSE